MARKCNKIQTKESPNASDESEESEGEFAPADVGCVDYFKEGERKRFSLSPAGAIQGTTQYDTNEGRKIYKDATHKLTESLFDCVPEDLFQFLQILEDRALRNSTGGKESYAFQWT